MISNVIRIATDIGTGVLATEIIKKLAPTGSMSPIKKIFCGIGAFGLTEHLRQSSVKAVDKDISDVRSTLKDVEKLLAKHDDSEPEPDKSPADSIPASEWRQALKNHVIFFGNSDKEVISELDNMSDEAIKDLMKEAFDNEEKLKVIK